MTTDELLKAVNDTKMTQEELTQVLGASLRLVQREAFRAEEAGIRAKAQAVAQEFEAAAQAEHEKFVAADAALQTP